jgi:hypothetical protein
VCSEFIAEDADDVDVDDEDEDDGETTIGVDKEEAIAVAMEGEVGGVGMDVCVADSSVKIRSVTSLIGGEGGEDKDLARFVLRIGRADD